MYFEETEIKCNYFWKAIAIFCQINCWIFSCLWRQVLLYFMIISHYDHTRNLNFLFTFSICRFCTMYFSLVLGPLIRVHENMQFMKIMVLSRISRNGKCSTYEFALFLKNLDPCDKVYAGSTPPPSPPPKTNRCKVSCVTLLTNNVCGLFTQIFSWTGTGNGRIGFLYIMLKFSHYSRSGTVLGPMAIQIIFVPFPASMTVEIYIV